MQNTFYRYLLAHNAQHLQLTTLHNLTYVLLPYYSIISWYCRNWGLIFGITFYQSNYLLTIFNSTQPTVRSHQLLLNIDDPDHGQPWRIFLAKCRGRLLFVIYASRGALYNSTLITISNSSLRIARTSARLFQFTITQFWGSNKKVAAFNPLQFILHHCLFTIRIVQITSAKMNNSRYTVCWDLPNFCTECIVINIKLGIKLFSHNSHNCVQQ